MTITKNVNPLIYKSLKKESFDAIQAYINDPMTATYFYDKDDRPSGPNIVTAEVVYYWMISLGIPMECQKWHFNRLIALIRVCNIKSNTGKKMSRSEIVSRNRALNEERKRKYKTRG